MHALSPRTSLPSSSTILSHARSFFLYCNRVIFSWEYPANSSSAVFSICSRSRSSLRSNGYARFHPNTISFSIRPSVPFSDWFSTKQISPSPDFYRKFSSTQQFSGCSCSKSFSENGCIQSFFPSDSSRIFWITVRSFDTLLLLKSMPPLSSVQTITIISHSPSCRLSFSLRIAPSLSVPADPDVVVFILTPLL